MKTDAEITISIGQYENIKPKIIIDTDNLDEAKETLLKLWDIFHNVVQYRPTKSPENLVDSMEEANVLSETPLVDKLSKDVRAGKVILFEEWDKLTSLQKAFLHKQQLLFDAERRSKKKDANTKELDSAQSK
jgi:hypothetical protein